MPARPRGAAGTGPEQVGPTAVHRPAARGPAPAGRQLTARAIVIRRSDFRESSRIVTCLTREHGRIDALAKGAHRPDSPFLGRIDFLNLVEATFSVDRGGLRLLVRCNLVADHRTLRAPRRYAAASHLAWLCEFAMPDRRPEPEVFDLLQGGIHLLERCPEPAVPAIVLGLELRLLETLGALPDLDRCSAGGCSLAAGAFRSGDGHGLFCRTHAAAPRQAIGAEALAVLRALRAAPGREWPHLELPVAARIAAPLPLAWLQAATELRPRLRALVFASDRAGAH